MQIRRLILTAALAVGTAAASAAPLAASDSFDYQDGSSIAGRNGGSGWAGAWQRSPAGKAEIEEVNGDTRLEFTGADNGNAAFRQLAASYSGSVLVDFTVRYKGTLGANDFLGLWLDNVASGDHTNRPNLGIKGNCGTNCSNDVFGRLSGTGGTFVALSDLAADTDYRIAAVLSKTSGNVYNRLDVWLNPVGDLVDFGGTSHLTTTGSSGLTSFNMLGFRTANLANSGSNPNVFVDDLSIRAVPEPGSLALLGSALVLAGVARRRKG